MLKLYDEKLSWQQEIRYRGYFLLFAGILYGLFIGNVHLFDWDEINFAEAAREMIVTGDYLNVRIDFQPFHEKPPLFIWMQALSMKIFGINEAAARFPNVIIGIITLSFLFKIGRQIFDKNFGYIWALVYFGSFLPFFYFKSSIIDPAFNLFMFGGVYYLFRFSSESIENGHRNLKFILFAGLFTAAAFMTKGPVGFMLVFIPWAIFWGLNIKNFKLPVSEILLFSAISFLPAVIWYTAIFIQQGGGLISEFISYQIRLLTTGDAGHEGPFFYHFVVVFLGCFPASIFIFRAFKNQNSDTDSQKYFKQFNIILLAIVLIIFSIVKTKIVHYSSLAYFPVTFLAAYTMHKIITGKITNKISTAIGLSVMGILMALLFIAFPLFLMNVESFLPQIKDELTLAVLQSDVTWTGLELLVGLSMLVGVILFIVYNNRGQYLKSYFAIFYSSAVAIFMFMTVMAPKIEAYTQRANVEFFQSLQGQDVYVHTLGYKSYAPFFYQQKDYQNSKYALKMNGREYEDFLLTGNIDKPAYFAAKIDKIKHYIELQPDLIEIYRKNGFVYFKRLQKE
ncbi:MAG: glycosyltransferase family 39 protein [Candidatus Kapabacteria bacterium]|nr:glycosyltransferase family 39 protein [Ignavibacteriota bacterium]MCW5884801.1 glycosyltransferase family 39 protein [Candidatus Kapabacteria bacterium]